MVVKKSFNQNLCELRRKKKISQRQVAEDLEISQSLLSHYEKGVREPGLDFLVRAAKYYGVSTDSILGCEQPEDAILSVLKEVLDLCADNQNKSRSELINLIKSALSD